MATNFVPYRTCSLTAEVSHDPLDRFSQSFHHTVGIEWQMINPTFFFRYLKGRCHGNQFSGKMRQNYLPPALIALLFQHGMGYHYHNVRVNSENDACKSCLNFVKFGQVTSDLTGLICERQIRHCQKKLAHLVEYLRTYWTDFRNLFTI